MKKVVIVTGASRGIGAATVKLLASQGYAVCVNYRARQQAAEEVVSSIKKMGAEAIAIQADVSVESQVISMFDQVESELGKVTHLVNNAGQLQTQAPLGQISIERFNHIMQSNVTSCFLCCREMINRLDMEGAIVNVSSGASRSGAPNEYVDYAASKGAMDSLTIGLAKEIAPRNIRVNCVRPGFIETEMHADGGEPDRVANRKGIIPLQRGGTAQEVANSIAWLLSDEASFVTGSFIDVTGGC